MKSLGSVAHTHNSKMSFLMSTNHTGFMFVKAHLNPYVKIKLCIY
jgi:hypothetical protein